MKLEKFSVHLSQEDVMDVMMLIKGGIIVKFALNYRTLINKKWEVVYRGDNFHGFLHEQRFRISSKPRPLINEESFPLASIVAEYYKFIKENFQKYKTYFMRRR
ncbi:MAG: hypothetical protein ABIB71_02955 [Candidatus Woesearchaeota archaeon]